MNEDDVTAPNPQAGPVIAIVGPTAVGKSAVAERVAAAVGGEIVSADSMQVYRGMDVGTAKTPLDARTVPHHCIDLVDPGTSYSAALYQHDARSAFSRIRSKGLRPVLVGGTGLYVRAALDEMDFPEGETGSLVRDSIERLASSLGTQGMHARLAKLDPRSAALIHPNNVRRVIRALEMLEAGGPTYAEQASGFARRRFAIPALLVGLGMERARLYARIDTRVDAMIEAGLLEEVAGLLSHGYRDALTATQAIGYKELVPVIEGATRLDEAIASIKQASRRYAKRQMTWFRADPRIRWIDVTEMSSEDALFAVRALVESQEDS